jgi:hypothetical protein
MLFGWILVSILFFCHLKAHHAALFTVIGGWLLLPMTGYDLPGIPEYSKGTAIALGLILGSPFSVKRKAFLFNRTRYDLPKTAHKMPGISDYSKSTAVARSLHYSGSISRKIKIFPFKLTLFDLPMIVWCLCPIATSLSNQLGLYDGLSASFGHIMIWGVPFAAGRIYYNTLVKLRDLCLGIIIGGLIYVPLCLYEIRMSPQLSNIFYGFFPHSFLQHMRYGGFRPIVFMQHGLMVALWMAVSFTVAFWFWRSREIRFFKKIPMFFIVAALFITTVLCKSANGWFFIALGCFSYLIYRQSKKNILFLVLLLVIPSYIGLRSTGFVSSSAVKKVAGVFFDEDRVDSLGHRLLQEDLIGREAFKRPWLGWGGWGRGLPEDRYSGKKIITTRDSLWLITFNTSGVIGLISIYICLLIGPWILLNAKRNNRLPYQVDNIMVLLSLVVVFFSIDTLFNGMVSPLYIMISGALISSYIYLRKNNYFSQKFRPSRINISRRVKHRSIAPVNRI